MSKPMLSVYAFKVSYSGALGNVIFEKVAVNFFNDENNGSKVLLLLLFLEEMGQRERGRDS